jgi:hypothetical protein
MKDRVTVTTDRELIVQAKRQAHQTGTQPAGTTQLDRSGFVERWAGQFTVREGGTKDLRLQALKTKHGIA